MMAPSSPARMTWGVTTETSIIPFPTVFATAVPTVKAATKLKNAAQTTAVSGESTRVPTIVAMEFAESWNPLMKSKTNAMRTIAMTYVATGPLASGVLERDALEHDRHRLAAVERLLDRVVDLLPLHHVERVGAAGEERLHRVVV